MNIGEFLTRDSILLSIKATDYAHALERASIHLSHISEQRQQQILSALLQREAKGTTALGHGVALPHARCENIRQPYGVFFRFTEPLSTESPDNTPVEIAFVLIAPESANASYLRAVGKIATILKSEEKRAQLKTSDDKNLIYALLTSEDT